LARKVLLADDSVTAQNMGRKILSDAGYEVTTVNNGSAALKKIAENRPDLVVLDIYMPGYSGLEVCQRLKESADTADLPVLLTVGKLEPFKPEESQRVRADAFIVKPFEASELLSTLSKLEDKVVPRSDGAKPGRSARGVSRMDGKLQDEDSTWRDRIKFPSFKKEEPEPSPDDPALYNQVNRDLRTVIDKPAIDQPAPPSAIPADATHEELAALAAAVSKLSGMQSAPAEMPKPVDKSIAADAITAPPEKEPEPAVAKLEAQETPAGQLEAAGPSSVDPVAASAEAKPEAVAEPVAPAAELPTEQDVQAAIASLTSAGHETNEGKSESSDLPVTMAAASQETQASAETRWQAVAVEVSTQEAALSLEREMEMAYAAAAGNGATAVGVVVPAPDAMREPHEAASPAQPAPEQPTVLSEPAAPLQSQGIAAPEVQAVPAVAEPSVAEPLPQHEPESAPVAQVTSPAADLHALEQPPPAVPEPPAPVQEAAHAVAAGAERLIEEAQAATPAADPLEIASIVESVMAQLRPKLVEEITRKLAADRK